MKQIKDIFSDKEKQMPIEKLGLSKDTRHKHIVMITKPRKDWGYYEPDVLYKSMTMSEIKTYMDEIEHYQTIPLDSCLYSINLNFQDIFQKRFFITSDPTQKRSDGRCSGGFERSESILDICIGMRNNCKCSPKDCFKNIQNGKCTDNFICEIICQKLFKDEYNTNTK